MFSARIDFALHDQIVNINLTYHVLRSALAAKSFGVYDDFSATIFLLNNSHTLIVYKCDHLTLGNSLRRLGLIE